MASSFLQSMAAAAKAEWSATNEQAILEPYSYLLTNPGKEVRGEIVKAFNAWLNVPNEKLSIIARVVRMLHTASLLVDDIEDDSQLRRGAPVAHKIYGIPQTINTANYVYFLAYRDLALLRPRTPVPSRSGTPAPEGVSAASSRRIVSDHELDLIVTDELLSLHRGQGLEILWRDSLTCPTEEEYLLMVSCKTGGLLRLAVKLMMACATNNVDVDYVPLVNLMGIYFQIRDDYLNLRSAVYKTGKGFAEDLTEGKFSFPIVHSVRADTSNRQILNVLQKRPTTPTLKIHAIDYMNTRTKSFEYTLSVLAELEGQLRAEVARLGGNPLLEKIIDAWTVDENEADPALHTGREGVRMK